MRSEILFLTLFYHDSWVCIHFSFPFLDTTLTRRKVWCTLGLCLMILWDSVADHDFLTHNLFYLGLDCRLFGRCELFGFFTIEGKLFLKTLLRFLFLDCFFSNFLIFRIFFGWLSVLWFFGFSKGRSLSFSSCLSLSISLSASFFGCDIHQFFQSLAKCWQFFLNSVNLLFLIFLWNVFCRNGLYFFYIFHWLFTPATFFCKSFWPPFLFVNRCCFFGRFFRDNLLWKCFDYRFFGDWFSFLNLYRLWTRNLPCLFQTKLRVEKGRPDGCSTFTFTNLIHNELMNSQSDWSLSWWLSLTQAMIFFGFCLETC